MTDPRDEPLAVVGMAGRFPGAPDLDRFWELLIRGGDAIGPVPAERWDATAQLDREKQVPAMGGFLEDVGAFDPTFFGISPREAASMDPQQRLMLETSWLALEDAGTRSRDIAGSRTGVYVGALWHDYEVLRKDRGAPATQHSAYGNANDMIATRVSYVLRLRGPSLTLETGCSASLVALHTAAQALWNGEIDAALVGGTNLMLTPDLTVGLTHFGGLSPTGRCHAFSAAADGYVRGEGVAVVYLKTLAQARRDGDRIHGLVERSVVNNDGGGDSVVTPDVAGQEDLLRLAYGDGRIAVDEVAYIEAHGTGTGRGDPVEARAIGRVLGQHRDPRRGPLRIGSVKSNIGHLEATAGLAGVIKVLLAMRHGMVPPSLHADLLNPAIAFEELNLEVVREPYTLPAGPYRAGVSSFGWGGTNAHVVLHTPPDAPPAPDGDTTPQPGQLVLSAHEPAALLQRSRDIAAMLAAGAPAGPIAANLAWRRDHFQHRVAVVHDAATDAAELLTAFAEQDADSIADTAGVVMPVPGVVAGHARRPGRVAFVFPGQGTQWAGLGRELLAGDAAFAAAVRRCAEALRPYIDWDLLAVLDGTAGDEWLNRVDIVQPTLWAVSVGLAACWQAAGIVPDVVIGHSQGEVGAATVAGILSLDDAAMIVARRSALARRTSGRGRMLAVELDVAGAQAALEGFEETVSLAVNNGPRSCVLSGDDDSIQLLKELLEADGVFCRLVKVDYASHSPQMDELRADLLNELKDVRPRKATLKLMSTVTARMLTGTEMDAAYWADNLRCPVIFAEAMSALFDDGVTHVVEISGHPVLTAAAQELASFHPDPPRVFGTLRRTEGTPRDLALAVATAYVHGLEPFGRLSRGGPAPLPAYPWQRSTYWVEPGRRRPGLAGELGVELRPSPNEPDTWEGHLELDLQEPPWLADHRVHDAVVFPAAGMLTVAIDTARARTGACPRLLDTVTFSQHLTIGSDPVPVTTVWTENGAGCGVVTVLSLPGQGAGWTTHAALEVRAEDGDAADATFPQHLLAGQDVGPAAFYSSQAARGLNYGDMLRGVRELYHGGEETLGHVVLPHQCRAAARPHALHPVLLDTILQVALPLCPGDGTVVPNSIRAVRLLRDPAEPVIEVWAHAVTYGGTGEIDVVVFDAEQRTLLRIEGLVMHALEEPGDGALRPGLTLQLEFEELPAAEPVAVHAEVSTPDPGLRADANRLADALRSAAAADDVDHVVFLAPRTLGQQRLGLMALTELVRACSQRPVPPRLVIVTSGAQAVTAADRVAPGAALFWGFGRTVRQEHPELRVLLVDLDLDGEDDGWADRCAEAVRTAHDDEDQIVLRAGRQYAARLQRTDEPGSTAAQASWRRSESAFRLVPERPGLWEGLIFRPLIRREPQTGEVEVEIRAAALNFIDVMKAMGTYPDPAGRRLLGIECAGRITRVGPGVTGLRPGQHVVACVLPTLASHVTVRADHTRVLPGRLSDEEAVTLPIALTTAWHALHDLARVESGETVLIHSAAGGLGLAAVALARLAGAEVIATAGSPAKREYLRGLGIEHVFDSRSPAWADAVLSATGGRGVDVLLNSLTGPSIRLGLQVLAEGGRFIELGKRDLYADRRVALGLFTRSITFSAVDIAGMMARRPERFARLLATVWKLVERGEVDPLPGTALPMAQVAEAMRDMSRGTHIGKFVLRAGPPPVVAPDVPDQDSLRQDASYLVTGGLGGLGLELADHLAAAGAGVLILIGRSAPSPEAERRITALRRSGNRVETRQVDVTDTVALTRLLDDVRSSLPPLRGVFHAAGVLDDATIATLRSEQIERVLGPKVDGARYLDAATVEDPLDMFVLFSSVAGLVGLPGQGAYAAANAYLDALAEARRRRGVPGLSIQWGPFADIGLAQGEHRGSRLAERGMQGLATADAWPALMDLLRADVQVASVVRLNLRQWLDSYPETAARRSWSRLLAETSSPGGTRSGSSTALLTSLEQITGADRLALVENHVRELAGRVLRFDATRVPHDVPFRDLGLDSLLSIEFRNRLEAAFGLTLSPTLLWTYGTVRSLATALAERLPGAEQPADTRSS
ncbi:type I polyketide synthase [Actinoplanes sp. N902-109]|uniref:type I polyketide synthase n=1 Tax=Actinoplanes sp. (strain N902-109) TaxID=649831 RepID=UPI0003295720|nr:type I polyketide synthase [Actinoplanes sp. N902-109]AGL13749.1 Acyl transferase [Actinoplanes sp. N902-109]